MSLYTAKAIPTEYEGILFRSRLEARTACFFDHLGWDWEYEPKRFILFHGEIYTPDFLITTKVDKIWVEVKPSSNIEEKWWDKFKLFSKEFDGWLFLAFGKNIGYDLWLKDGQYEFDEQKLRDCKKCLNTTIYASCGLWVCRNCGKGGKYNFQDISNTIFDWKRNSAVNLQTVTDARKELLGEILEEHPNLEKIWRKSLNELNNPKLFRSLQY